MIQAIPYVQESDLARWRKVLESVSPRILSAIEAGALQNGRQIMLHFRSSLNTAALAFVSENIPLMLENFREALVRFHWFFLPKYDSQVDPQYVYEACEEALCVAMIIRDANAAALAQQIRPFCKDQTDARADFIASVSALLDGQREFGELMAGSLIRKPTLVYGKWLPKAIVSVAHRDLAEFLVAINEATIEFDRHIARDARGTPEAAIFTRGAALLGLYEIVNGEKPDWNGLDVRLLGSIQN